MSHNLIQKVPDSISSLSWASGSNTIAAGCWDNNVYVWSDRGKTNIEKFCNFSHQAPVLDVEHSPDGQYLFSAGVDRIVQCFNYANTNLSPSTVAKHRAPIKTVNFSKTKNLLITGSWDRTIAFWDVRAGNKTPVSFLNLGERIYSADIRGDTLVVAKAGQSIDIFDLRKPPTKPVETLKNPIHYQTRVVKVMPSSSPQKSAFVIGSISGRIALQYLHPQYRGKSFTFQAHRNHSKVYSVNDFSFHPKTEALASCGSDGTVTFWHLAKTEILKQFPSIKIPISCCSFSSSGNLFAYAASYDWSRGAGDYNPNATHALYFHRVQPAEVTAK